MDDVLVSRHAGHVASLVEQCRSADGLLIAGGDGTIFEVLQACDRARQRLGVLPLGRGNSLARDLDLDSVTRGLESVKAGVDRAIDLLDVTLYWEGGREWRGVSASNLAIGYPAAVASGARRFRWLGAQSYTAAGLLAQPQWSHMRMATGDVPAAARLTGLIVSNSRYVGPFLGFPAADLSDGLFHTMELSSGRLRQLAHNASSVLGLGVYEPVARRDLQSLRLWFEAPQLVKIDGELREAVSEISVNLLPRAATFRVPAPRHG